MTWRPGPGVVVLPSGRTVRGRGLRHPLPAGDVPELGVYLLGHEPPPTGWEQRWVRWPDFRLPADRAAAVDVLREVLELSGTRRVELACAGGRGRTGTALAVLAVLDGIDPLVAVAWAREHYHPRAVETDWQRRWVRSQTRVGDAS